MLLNMHQKPVQDGPARFACSSELCPRISLTTKGSYWKVNKELFGSVRAEILVALLGERCVCVAQCSCGSKVVKPIPANCLLQLHSAVLLSVGTRLHSITRDQWL